VTKKHFRSRRSSPGFNGAGGCPPVVTVEFKDCEKVILASMEPEVALRL